MSLDPRAGNYTFVDKVTETVYYGKKWGFSEKMLDLSLSFFTFYLDFHRREAVPWILSKLLLRFSRARSLYPTVLFVAELIR